MSGTHQSTRSHNLKPLSTCAAGLLFIFAGTQANAAAEEAQSPQVTVTVNPSNKHPISPYIYGINFASKLESVPVGFTLDRSGGNRWTAYNWENNASNAGSDYLYQNDNGISGSKEAGAGVASLIADDQKLRVASIVTLQMQGLVAADVNGPVSVANPPDKSRFKKVVYEKKSVSQEPFTLKPSVSDDNVYMDEFIWALDKKFAGQNIFGANPSTHPVFISLDNEPELWKSTHLEIQGKTGVTVDAYIAKTIALASALKKQFPDAVTLGPVNFGFMGMYNWFGEVNASPAGHDWFADKYLTAVKTASSSFGKPLVDVYDFHWYPEATDDGGKRIISLTGPSLTDAQVQAIAQSPRSLWDKTYKEKSWISNNVLNQPIDIIDRLQSRIEAENPGMKLALTEYDNGGGQHIAGTLAQADNLGAFGARGLFAASLLLLTPKEPYTFGGFRAYRNFDGANHNFGDTSIATVSSDAGKVTVYVSTDSGRADRVIMVAINRSPSEQRTLISGQPLSGAAHLFQMTAGTASTQKVVQPVAAGVQPVSGSSITLTLPGLSVTTVDIYQ